MRPHEGLSQADAHVRVSTTVLSQTIAFHEPIDGSQWLLLAHRSPYAGRGRSYGRADVWQGDTLVASFVQENMIRGLPAGRSAGGRRAGTALTWRSSPDATSLAGRVAVVTGGGAGLGRGIAAGLAAFGAEVADLGAQPRDVRVGRRRGGRPAGRHRRPPGRPGRPRPSTPPSPATAASTCW